jgi:glycosyltransferase involved in cell wall biosynthesis
VSVQAGPQRVSLYDQWNHDLLRECDLVITVSEPLQEWLGNYVDEQRIYLVPNGVPQRWVEADVSPVARRQLTPRPERSIAGFVGSLFEWLDQDLLIAAARTLPMVEFVLVGPQRRGVKVDQLQKMENVHIYPPVSFEEVPRYIKAMDVCLIPFKKDQISEAADPLKVYEYCALGKPVISTVGFRSGVAEVPAHVAEGATDFVSAIIAAVAEEDPEKQNARKVFARQHTWDVRADAFVNVLGDAYSRF